MVTIGSDAHSPEFLAFHFDEVAVLLKNTESVNIQCLKNGLRYFMIFNACYFREKYDIWRLNFCFFQLFLLMHLLFYQFLPSLYGKKG